MNPVLTIAFPLLFGVGGFMAGVRFAAGMTAVTGTLLIRRRKHLVVVACLPLALMVANLLLETRLDWQWRLPFWVQAYSAEVFLVLVYGCSNYLFGVVAGVCFGAQHPRRRLILAGAVLLAAAQPFVSRPASPKLLRLNGQRISASGDILQSTPYTCVPAAMANIARRYGVVMTEAELAAAAGTTKDGTSAGRAALVFRRLGFPVVKRTITSGNLEALIPPAILSVDGDSHVVAFFGLTNGMASIVDSSSGLRLATRQRLAERWTGRALEIGAPKPE